MKLFETIFQSTYDPFNNLTSYQASLKTALLCLGVAVLLGLLTAAVFRLGNREASKSSLITLVLLPALVQVIIMLVNGNLGTGIAVAGAFTLIRFRSAPGSARDITAVCVSMATGLALGMGFLWYAVIFNVIVNAVFLALSFVPVGDGTGKARRLTVVIADSIDYTTVFQDEFSTYLKRYEVQKVKTTNLGSMFEIRYSVELRDESKEKEFLDALRCKNGNLPIVCSRLYSSKEEF